MAAINQNNSDKKPTIGGVWVDDQNGRRPKYKTTQMEDDQNGRQTKMENDQNVRTEKVRDTKKNGPQIWTAVKY